MIGKIISDHLGITKFFGGTVNNKINFETKVDDFELDKLKSKIETLDGDEIRIRAAVDESSLKDIDGLANYAVDRTKQGKDINKEGVTELINTQIANQAHGILGVNAAIKEYNKLTDTASRTKLAETISNTNSSLGKYLTGLNNADAGMIGYAGSLATATAKTIGLQAATMAMNTAVSFGVSALITTGISLVTYLINKEDELSKKAQEVGQQFNNTTTDIDSYKSKIEELKQVISDSSSSYEEVINARRDLLGIQEELIEKYGSEAEGINAITEAIHGETDALDNLKKFEWYDSKKDFNQTNWKENVLNGVKRFFTDPFGLTTFISNISQATGITEQPLIQNSNTHLEDTLNKWNNQKINLPKSGNKSVDNLMDKLLTRGSKDWLSGDFTGGYDGYGSVAELKDTLGQIKSFADSQNNVDENFLNQLQAALDSLQEKYEENYQLISNATLYDKIKSDDPNNTYDEELNKLEIIKSKYDKALLTADEEKINKYAQEYVEALNAAMALALNNGDKDVSEYFYNMFPSMKEVINKTNFKEQLSSDNSFNNEKKTLSVFDKDDILKFLTSKEQENGEKAFSNIRKKAIEDGVILNDSIEETEKLIDLLVEWGVLKDKANEESNKNQKDAQKSTPQNFREAWKSIGKTGTDEDKKAALEAKESVLELAKAGKLTGEQLKKSGIADVFEDANVTIEEATRKINRMVDASGQLSSMKSGIKSISDVLAQKKENLSNKNTREVGIGADTLAGFDADIKGLDSWKEFEKTLGDGKKSLDACRKAANKLATEWVNSNNFLSQLDKTSEGFFTSSLTDMGVENAEEIVSGLLAQKEEETALEAQFAKVTTDDLTQATEEQINTVIREIDVLAQEENMTEEARQALYHMALEKMIANGIKLDTVADITALESLISKIGGASEALESLKKLKNDLGNKTLENDVKNDVNGLKRTEFTAGTKVAIVVTPKSKDDNKPKKSNKSNKKNETNKPNKSTQIIDWIARRLEVLQSAIDLTKAKFENLFNLKAQKNNLNKQIAQTAKLLNAQSKAAEKYQKKANSVKLSGGLKKKVQNGDITGSLSELIATYGDKKANQITKYQDYLDKAKNARKEIQSLRTELKALKDQADQLYVDRADQHISTLDAEGELIQSAKGKNELERKKIKWVKQSYNYQIKIAKREKDSVKVAQLRAQKEKEILDIKKQILQNALDENNAIRENAEARYKNATTVEDKNRILDAEINSYQSDMAENNSYYNGRKVDIKANGLGTQSVPNDIKKALNASKVKEANQKKILNCIKSGKKIPDHLLNLTNVKNNPGLLQKLLDYNTDMNDKINAELDSLTQKQDTTNQETIANITNAQEQQLQNYVDDHKAKYDLLQLQEDNAVSAKDKNALESQSLQELKEQYAYELAIAKLKGDVTEQARIQAEWEAKWTDSYQKQYNNIKTEYDNVIKLNEAKISTTQAQISALEAQGKTISESMYRDLMSQTAENHKKLIEERNALAAKMSGMVYGSDEYYAARQDLEALDQAILQCDEDLAGFQANINKLNLSLFDRKASFIDSEIDYLEYLTDIISHSDLTSKDAYGLTDEGFATISLYLDEIEKYKEKALNAKDAAAELQRQFDSGEYNGSWEDAQEDIQSYLDTEREAIKSTLDFRDSIKSLVKEAFDIQLDALDELIDKRKKALQTEKNLYDYQRKIADHNKEIASIEKQMTALTGDNSEETRATIQKLKISLEDAKQDLEDTKYDKWISDQEDMLDNMREDLSDMFESVLNDTDKLIESVKTAVNNNGGLLNQIFEKMGYGNPYAMKKTEHEDGSATYEYAETDGSKIIIHVDKNGNLMSDKNGDGVYESDASGQEQFTPPPESQTAPQPEPLPEIQVPDYANDGLLYRDIPDETGADSPQKTWANQLLGEYPNGLNINDDGNDGVKLLKQALKAVVDRDGAILNYGIDTTNNKWGVGLEAAIAWFKDVYLGKPNGDVTNVSTKFINTLAAELMSGGFATGGIAQLQSGILRKTGEDGWVLARNGEGFVRPEDVPAVKELINYVPDMNNLMNNLEPLKNLPIPINHQHSESVNIGDVNIRLDGSHVTDPQSFIKTVKQSREVQKAIQDATIGQVIKPYNNRLTI